MASRVNIQDERQMGQVELRANRVCGTRRPSGLLLVPQSDTIAQWHFPCQKITRVLSLHTSKHRTTVGLRVHVWSPLVAAQRDIVQTFFRLSWFRNRRFSLCAQHIVYLFRYTSFSLWHPFIVNLVFRELLLVSVVDARSIIFSSLISLHCSYTTPTPFATPPTQNTFSKLTKRFFFLRVEARAEWCK